MLVRRTFFMSPGLPKIGLLHRTSELAVTVPKPRRHRVAILLLASYQRLIHCGRSKRFLLNGCIVDGKTKYNSGSNNSKSTT